MPKLNDTHLANHGDAFISCKVKYIKLINIYLAVNGGVVPSNDVQVADIAPVAQQARVLKY